MNLVHLTASTFYGGPERQMFGLARALAGDCRTSFVLFAEGGRCRSFAEEANGRGFDTTVLVNDTPHLLPALRELTERMRQERAEMLLCHGYKANLLGRIAARRCGIPAVAVSRGWTAESLRVRMYEQLDRWNLRWMDRVVCVSEGQAAKVRCAGVRDNRITVIRNAVRTDRFPNPRPAQRTRLEHMFPTPPKRIIGAAGRLSPEKGFGVLVEAAARIADSSTGFVHFGDGPLREQVQQRIETLGLANRFVLAGFRNDLDHLMPCFDVLALPSFTEGLPNVVLEAFAAGVPVVATAVGGTPEIVQDGVNGRLVSPGEPTQLADRIRDVLTDDAERNAMGARGRRRVLDEFTFEAQARHYLQLFGELQPIARTAQKRSLAHASGW
jgi:glycosyltransferase involved in cell wall biosynthesis